MKVVDSETIGEIHKKNKSSLIFLVAMLFYMLKYG